ncbi:MAG: lamin tail domain-containing protein [Chloroflexia bacterium]|nr:lamin tail domain-containing protein [Chloroflexia bacterium]
MLQRNRFLLEAITIIVIAVVIGVLIAFYDRIIGTEPTNAPIVINEIYMAYTEPNPGPHQWVELFNASGDWRTLKGWSLQTEDAGRLGLPEMTLPPKGYAIVAGDLQVFAADQPNFTGLVVGPSGGGWAMLKHHSDFLILRNAEEQAVDMVNWGYPVENPPANIGAENALWKTPTFGSGAPWVLPPAGEENFPMTSLEPLEFSHAWIVEGASSPEDEPYQVTKVNVEHSLERRTIGVDTNSPGDFIRQPFPSPASVNVPASTRAAQLLFIDWTNAVSFAGGIILWVAFVYIALIARRFEALTQQRTYWQAMLVSPVGILIYNIVQAYGFLTRGSMTPGEQRFSFLVLFFSALACTALVYVFRRRAQRILEG